MDLVLIGNMDLQKNIREETSMSSFLRRRIDFNNLDNLIDDAKEENFWEDLKITYSIENTILSVLYKIMPEEDSITKDIGIYYKIWDELKLYLTDRYYDELYRYFEKKKQMMDLQENITRIKEMMKLSLNQEINSIISESGDKKITCDKCGWSWKLSEGGDDPYTCHKCGYETTHDTDK